jgi:RNase adaptor protein for sRNA GlmZ degradation
VCAGKTTLADGLSEATGARVLSTRQLLSNLMGKERTHHRRTLQRLGDELDAAAGGEWIAAAVRDVTGPYSLVIVDAVRKLEQVAAVRALTPARHIYLTADHEVLTARYDRVRAARPDAELPSLSDVRLHPTEAAIERLAESADLRIDTGRYDKTQTLEQAVALIRA